MSDPAITSLCDGRVVFTDANGRTFTIRYSDIPADRLPQSLELMRLNAVKFFEDKP